MIRSVPENSGNVEMTVLSMDQKISAGRQNLLASIWGGRHSVSTIAMPNGDPPSLMLWGDEEENQDKRGKRRHS